MRGLTLVLVATLAGCASLSQEECVRSDWQAIGESDGRDGYPLSRITEHREACYEYGVQPDLIAYKVGHEKGLVSYCTFKGGYKAGYNGRSYHGLCPAEKEAEFRDGYDIGLDVYRDKLRYDLFFHSRFHRFHHRHHHGYFW